MKNFHKGCFPFGSEVVCFRWLESVGPNHCVKLCHQEHADTCRKLTGMD